MADAGPIAHPVPCPLCQADNGSERHFCRVCGSGLGDPCCGFLNQSGDLFCGGCGRLRITLRSSQGAAAAPVARGRETGLGWHPDPAELADDLSVEAVAQALADRKPVHLGQAELDKMFEDD